MSYQSKSKAKNVAFAKEVNALIVSGVKPTVAKNVVRWKRANWKPVFKKAWYGLSPEQCAGPSVKLAVKVERGTVAGDALSPVADSVKWQHVVLTKAGLMYDRRTQAEFAFDCHL